MCQALTRRYAVEKVHFMFSGIIMQLTHEAQREFAIFSLIVSNAVH